MKPLLNIREVIEILNVSDSTIRRLVSTKELKCYKIGGQLRFKPDDIERYLNQTSNI